MADWSQGAQGAAGGAMAGTALGGPLGGLIGGGLGLLGGLFGGGDEKDEYQKLLSDMYKGYQGQQIGPAQQAQNSGLVTNRQNYISSLEQQAAGNGPSAARQLMQQGTDKAVRNANAMAQGAGGRGVNMGAALRNAQGMGANMQMQNTQNMGVMRAQEQLAAQQQLGGAINQGISSDNQMSQFNAQQQNQMEVARAANALGITSAQLQMIMGGASMASPGMGSSILAGGAQALPFLLQAHQAGAKTAAVPGIPQGPITSPSQVDPMAPYRRDPNTGQSLGSYGQQGPVTSPSQLPPINPYGV